MELTKNFLENQYVSLNKSGYRIAKELGLPKYTVDNAITRFKIKRRDLLSARLPIGSSGKPGFKWCPVCRRDKSIYDFNKGRGRFSRDGKCKKCQSVFVKRYFESRNIARQKIKAQVVIQLGNRCQDCGSQNLPIACFVFHHHSEKTSDKNYIAPTKVITSKQVSMISREKDKWTLLCANCHSLRHSICRLNAKEITQ